MPYFAFGVRPTFFDAPSTDDRDYEFRAAAFLTASPDALMTPVVEPLCGFSWGYRVVDETPHIDPARAGRRRRVGVDAPNARAGLPSLDLPRGRPTG